MCVFKLKGWQQLSAKNVVWLAICVFIYALLLIVFVRHLAEFADSMATVVSILGRQGIPKFTRPRLPNTKYILLWKRNMKHIKYLKRNVSSNCFWTEDRSYFGGDHTLFDAIVFDHTHFTKKWVPIPRSSSQLYIFTSAESPTVYPACAPHNEDFFNWTFTYRLDSDIVWKFFVIRDLNGSVVAPNPSVKWNTTKNPVANEIKSILQGKNKSVAWIANNCKTIRSRDQHLMKLQEKLLHHSVKIDIYGDCNKMACADDDCEAMLRRDYYFYLAFDNSLDDDYVTREILHGYDNYVVPIVYGGADYNKFLPPGSYIDARSLHPHNLAEFIHLTTTHPTVHEAFFYWTNHYIVDSNYIIHTACDLCDALNSDRAKNAPPKKQFRVWWNTPHGMKWCLPDEFRNKFMKKNRNGSYIY